jgi:hypothetical protein
MLIGYFAKMTNADKFVVTKLFFKVMLVNMFIRVMIIMVIITTYYCMQTLQRKLDLCLILLQRLTLKQGIVIITSDFIVIIILFVIAVIALVDLKVIAFILA